MSPGACCKRLNLSGGPAMPSGGFIDSPMSFERAEHVAMQFGLPFRPSSQRIDGTWEWTCDQLTDAGRCGIYDDRPRLCRAFKPGADPLCVHFVPRDDEPALETAI
ncbi:YkgJ family cysteine cluster protein [Sphingomonas glacialis]